MVPMALQGWEMVVLAAVLGQVSLQVRSFSEEQKSICTYAHIVIMHKRIRTCEYNSTLIKDTLNKGHSE